MVVVPPLPPPGAAGGADDAAQLEALLREVPRGLLHRLGRARGGVELPALGADKTYQLWGVVDAGSDEPDVISLGIFGPNPELETFTTETPVVALAITIEDAPGVVSNGNPEGIYVGTIG